MMGRRHLGLVMVIVFSLLFGGLVVLPKTAQAEPIYLEENFSDCTLGETPTGWTLSSSGPLPSADCSAVVSEPYDNSMNVTRVDWVCCVPGYVTAPAINITEVSSFSVGFSIYWTQLSDAAASSAACDNSLVVMIRDSEVGIEHAAVAGICVDKDTDGGPYTLAYWVYPFGGWGDTGITLYANTWYDIRFDIRPYNPDKDYDLYLNGTYTGFTTGLGTCVSPCHFDEFRITTVGGRRDFGLHTEFWIDSILLGAPTITPLADATTCLNQDYGITAAVDTEVVWSMTGAPTGVTIGPASGIIDGVPTEEGDFTVSVTATTKAGFDVEEYTLTVENCAGGGWDVIIGGGVWEHATYEISPEQCAVGETEIAFMDTAVDPSVVLIYIWDFGDGSGVITSTNPNVTHNFPEPGIYTVTHAVMLSDGTALRLTQEVDVGVCKDEVGELFLNLLAGIIAAAVVLWLVFILTRKRQVMIGALLATLVGAAGWALLLPL